MVQSQAGAEAREGAEIRVIVVDHHDLFRSGLVVLLSHETGIKVAGQASSGRMGVRLVRELQPDVVLMAVRMPDLSGPQATRQILSHDPAVRVLALTVASDADDVAAAIGAGACGILAKETPPESLVTAIRAAASGAAWLSPKAADIVFARLRGADPPAAPLPALAQLSPREIEVLRLIAQGKGNAEIATALTISPRTAKNHVSSVLSKLGLPSRVQAAVFAVRQGVA